MAFDWRDSLYSQYANSPVILQFLQSLNDAVSVDEAIDLFYNDVWNVETAKGWGLDFWGRVVGVGRVIKINTTKYFGFEEAGDLSADPFGQSPFFPGFFSNDNYSLTDDAFRVLIYAKAAANIWDGSIPGYNAILRILFPGTVSYVEDNEDMSMTIVLGFTPTPVQQSILFNTGVLPAPACVSVTYDA